MKYFEYKEFDQKIGLVLNKIDELIHSQKETNRQLVALTQKMSKTDIPSSEQSPSRQSSSRQSPSHRSPSRSTRKRSLSRQSFSRSRKRSRSRSQSNRRREPSPPHRKRYDSEKRENRSPPRRRFPSPERCVHVKNIHTLDCGGDIVRIQTALKNKLDKYGNIIDIMVCNNWAKVTFERRSSAQGNYKKNLSFFFFFIK